LLSSDETKNTAPTSPHTDIAKRCRATEFIKSFATVVISGGAYVPATAMEGTISSSDANI
jgi:hypothetical protein